jgi:hypothetical protein
MKKTQRVLRHLVLIILIVLAVLGVGLSGGIPLNKVKSREDHVIDDIELVENDNEEEEIENI